MSPRKKSSAVKKTMKLDLSMEGVREVLGYLNFSDGSDDPQFFRHLNRVCSRLYNRGRRTRVLSENLLRILSEIPESEAAFSDTTQAVQVIPLALESVFEHYREYHTDLLFDIEARDLENPFFLGRVFQAVLRQGSPWNETERIVTGAIELLNDYVGYRPVAILENGRKMQVYDHERHRPLPLFLARAGAAIGPFEELIATSIEFLKAAPSDLLEESHFLLENLDELACDLRAYDHSHPAFKRTNYMFGEWDPHLIDSKGNYRRFVIRRNVLVALQDWVDDKKIKIPKAERLFDAAAALCGTMLMASSISGSGPQAHDSTTSLTTLLPIVARRRDEFYQRIMEAQTGPRADRLYELMMKTQQPFGHVRQYLNMHMAGYGAHQVQHRELAHLYALMGYAEASREQALAIPACSIRFESEIECTLTTIHQHLDRNDVLPAIELLESIPAMLNRGIECGALVDPWNILGFQGQFPLFSAREDAIPDSRIETLMGLMESIFHAFSRSLGEAGAHGLDEAGKRISVVYQGLADWWDRFGSDVIEDLPDVDGHESWEAATHVASIMQEWRAAGESAGDVTFWRDRVERFQSAQSYALVVDALLQKSDSVASMGLLMQWASQLDEVGVECPQHSIFSLLIRWMKLAVRELATGEEFSSRIAQIRRLFAFLEANAEGWWSVPRLRDNSGQQSSALPPELLFGEPLDDDDLDDESEVDDVFRAAYDDVVFRDSAEDGNWGDTVEGEFGAANGEFEAINREFEPRLKFLNAVGQLWQMAAAAFATALYQRQTTTVLDEPLIEAITNWHQQSQRWQIDLAELMENVWDRELSEPFGDHDGNVEYDVQLQVKFYLLHQVINTLICLQNAERLLNGIIPDEVAVARGTDQDRRLSQVYRAVVQRDRDAVREQLPALLSRLSRNPLLYVPLESGGDPGQILRTQALQSVIRFLLRELPQLGMFRETWHLLYTALRMERKWRPKGQAITEFDRLFQTALRCSLEALVRNVNSWSKREAEPEDYIDAVSKVLDPYQWLWSEHSRTMLISSVDRLRKEAEWEEIESFIKTYGGDLFHASQLSLGNIRAILHHGVDWYLDYLEEEQNPLAPIKLLEHLDAGMIDRDDTEWALEQIYSMLRDRFDRFLEYNTTTTQSDYGEMIYSLLEFLRLEARYDRDAWNLVPLVIVHDVLVRSGLLEATHAWEATFESQTELQADRYLRELRRLQKQHGMRMPTITDHLRERFVKPLAVNRMLALVKKAVSAAREGDFHSQEFELLNSEIEEYLNDSWGSGIDLPEWLHALDKEVHEATFPDEGGRPGTEADLDVPPLAITPTEFQQQVVNWQNPLGKSGLNRPKRKPTRRSSRPDPNLDDMDELD